MNAKKYLIGAAIAGLITTSVGVVPQLPVNSITVHATEVNKVDQLDSYRAAMVLKDGELATDAYISGRIKALTLGDEPYIFSNRKDMTDPAQLRNTTTDIYRMAIAYHNPKSEHYKSRELLDAIGGALGKVLGEFYQEGGTKFSNWWWTDLGIGTDLIRTSSVMHKELTPEFKHLVKSTYLSYVPEADKTYTATGSTYIQEGANKIAQATNHYTLALLTEDRELQSESIRHVERTMIRTGTNGFYADGSYIYHDRIVANATYAFEHLEALAQFFIIANEDDRLMVLAEGNFKEDLDRGILPVFDRGEVLDAFKGRSVAREGYNEPIAAGRALSDAIIISKYAAPDLVSKFYAKAKSKSQLNPLAQSYVTDPKPAEETDVNIAHEVGLRGIRTHKDGSKTTIALDSDKIAAYQSINGENLLGWYQGAGSLMIYNQNLSDQNGTYWATIDPYKIPGTTVSSAVRTPGEVITQPSMNRGGFSHVLTTNDLLVGSMKTDAHGLKANKMYVVSDGVAVVLGSGLEGASHTTVENRKASNYRVELADPDNGTISLVGDSVANTLVYKPLDDNRFEFETVERTASWKDVSSANTRTSPITESYHQITLDNKDGKPFAYSIQHGNGGASPKVLKNTDKVQLVQIGSSYALAIYEEEEVVLENGLRFRAPGVYVISPKGENQYEVALNSDASPSYLSGPGVTLTNSYTPYQSNRYHRILIEPTVSNTHARTYQADPQLELGQTRVERGQDELTDVKGEIVQERRDEVIYVGAKPSSRLIPYDQEVVIDETKPVGYREVTRPGVNGEEVTTYEVNSETGVLSSQTKIIKSAVGEVITEGRGANKVVEFKTLYKGDDSMTAGEVAVETSGEDGLVDVQGKVLKPAVNKVVRVGTKPVTRAVPFDIKKRVDGRLQPGETIITPGVEGEDLTTYDVNPDTGEVTATTKRTKEPVDELVSFGDERGSDNLDRPEVVEVVDPNLKPGEVVVVKPGVDGVNGEKAQDKVVHVGPSEHDNPKAEPPKPNPEAPSTPESSEAPKPTPTSPTTIGNKPVESDKVPKPESPSATKPADPISKPSNQDKPDEKPSGQSVNHEKPDEDVVEPVTTSSSGATNSGTQSSEPTITSPSNTGNSTTQSSTTVTTTTSSSVQTKSSSSSSVTSQTSPTTTRTESTTSQSSSTTTPSNREPSASTHASTKSSEGVSTSASNVKVLKADVKDPLPATGDKRNLLLTLVGAVMAVLGAFLFWKKSSNE